MTSLLPITGTNALLEELSPFIPDDFLCQQWPHTATGGRRRSFSAAQLWRLHLLVLLTPAHSVNLLLQMLPEQRGWRQFAHLASRQRIPDVRMMYEFRRQMGVAGLRRVNEVLLRFAGGLIAVRPPSRSCTPPICRRPVAVLKVHRAYRPHAALGGARSRPGRAVGLSATRNTRFDCGFRSSRARVAGRRWSVG
jgi:hypothetical protein